ncbi:MAG: NlpC/P60 family protein [Peptoniphilaceae bacterium]|nr:NlpC/P60 family protein [Peptoniphilaceae bacterium]MDD7383528.1 NlpC/P60 family protein [Peptoniphilaceae bacterium]MDY3738701.1 NlpC/P60 family protein [Peptoniphilaceae bacterium]
MRKDKINENYINYGKFYVFSKDTVFLYSSKDIKENNIISNIENFKEVEGIIEDGFLKTSNGYISINSLIKIENDDQILIEDDEMSNETLIIDDENIDFFEKSKNLFDGYISKKNGANVKDIFGNIIGNIEYMEKVSGILKENILEINYNGNIAFIDSSEISNSHKKSNNEKLKNIQNYRDTEIKNNEHFEGYVNCKFLNIRLGPGEEYSKISTVPKGVKLSGYKKGNWLKVDYNGKNGYVDISFLIKNQTKSDKDNIYKKNKNPHENDKNNRENIIRYAKSFIGYPYLRGSKSPNDGFDSSGFVFYVFSKFKINLNSSVNKQMENGYSIDLKEIDKSDLIFFYDKNNEESVGIILNKKGDFIHSSFGLGVNISNIFLKKYENEIIFARRIF